MYVGAGVVETVGNVKCLRVEVFMYDTRLSGVL